MKKRLDIYKETIAILKAQRKEVLKRVDDIDLLIKVYESRLENIDKGIKS